MKLDVPYYSQFLDVTDPYWMPRACGLCCMKMVLEFHGKEAPEVLSLAREAVAEGGYGKHGLFHDYIIKVFEQDDLASRREEKMGEEGVQILLTELKEGRPVIISATKLILGQTKFHMVVLTGYEEKGGALSGFYFHEPESTDREKGGHVFVSLEDFKKSWREMAIFAAKK